MTAAQETDDLKLVTALLSNATVPAAAEAAGISESTVYRRSGMRGFANSSRNNACGSTATL